MGSSTDRSRVPERRLPDDDLEKTLILKPPPPPPPLPPTPPVRRRSAAPLIAAGIVAATLAVGLAGWLLVGNSVFPPPHDPAPPIAATATIDAPARRAHEAEIVRHQSDRLTVFRLADNPRIVVVDYPSLTEQGLALNRLAAFVEKASVPKDRLLDDAALAREIEQAGDTTDTYYYGHDYAMADITRFFALADRDAVPLNQHEQALRALIAREKLTAADALITVSQVGGPVVDGFTRRVILRHELSHGEFFTNPTYAAYVRDAWAHRLTAPQRDAFRRFLQAQNYDVTNMDLVVNEMQAFLVFTPDERYVSADKLGMTDAELRALRQNFVAGMPEGWLRNLAGAPLP